MRRLTLKCEPLAALTGEELANVAGGAVQTQSPCLTWQVICTGQTDRLCVTISPDICSS